MSTNLNRYTLFSALTLLTLGSLQIPAMATSNGTISSAKQEAISAPSRTQDSVYLAQAGNCRMVSKDIGAVIYENSNKTGKTTTLPEGTLVEINPKNFSGNFIQVTAVNSTPRVGFVNKMTLTLCNSSGQPSVIAPVKPPSTACFKVRDIPEIANQGGLRVYPDPSTSQEPAFLQLTPGMVFKAAKSNVLGSNGQRWVKIAPINDVDGYVTAGTLNNPMMYLVSAPCP